MDKEWLQKQWNITSRRSSIRPLGDILSEITEKGLIGDKFTEVRIIGFYEQVVGTPIARQTEKLYVHKNKLFLSFSSSALRNEMLYARGKILERINEKLGNNGIKEVVLL